jgi:heme-degrading monooxygenase HmoA
MRQQQENNMVIEQFVVQVKPGQEPEFEEAMDRGLRTVMSRAEGMRGWRVRRCVEKPDHYQVQLRWDSVEAHMVGYREGPLAPEFRAIVTPFYANWPEALHYEDLAQG